MKRIREYLLYQRNENEDRKKVEESRRNFGFFLGFKGLLVEGIGESYRQKKTIVYVCFFVSFYFFSPFHVVSRDRQNVLVAGQNGF